MGFDDCRLVESNGKYCILVPGELGDPHDPALLTIRALRDIQMVENGEWITVAHRGDLGGWIEGPENLSYEGEAWIGPGAKVYGGARVEGDARVSDSAQVSGKSVIKDEAVVAEEAVVFGSVRVGGKAQISGSATVCLSAIVEGNAKVIDDALVCGWLPREFAFGYQYTGHSRSGQDTVASMSQWISGWSHIGMLPVVKNAGLVAPGARIFGSATVAEDSVVMENARVFGQAQVLGKAVVFENAQVFGRSIIHGHARLFGHAMVFLESGDRYAVSLVDFDTEEFAPVFPADDSARILWTNSFCLDSDWIEPRESVEGLALSIVNGYASYVDGGYEWSVDVEACTVDNADLIETEVYDNARVYGNARVWGGSRVYGHSHVLHNARVSGGAVMRAGSICYDLWVNANPYAIPVYCGSKAIL
ncbi:hypothetical protein [Candidatus Poriferisocius sp.]|uniref:hypothetical protein n=1 Tax=Candidatus Poriferisocius sp. TaxID=3101276 RepID=UPI003B5BB096